MVIFCHFCYWHKSQNDSPMTNISINGQFTTKDVDLICEIVTWESEIGKCWRRSCWHEVCQGVDTSWPQQWPKILTIELTGRDVTSSVYRRQVACHDLRDLWRWVNNTRDTRDSWRHHTKHLNIQVTSGSRVTGYSLSGWHIDWLLSLDPLIGLWQSWHCLEIVLRLSWNCLEKSLKSLSVFDTHEDLCTARPGHRGQGVESESRNVYDDVTHHTHVTLVQSTRFDLSPVTWPSSTRDVMWLAEDNVNKTFS